MTKLRAPEGVNSAAVEDTQYEVDEHGCIEVENGEHVAPLAQHGFTYADEAEIIVSAPVDEVGECPDFTKFVNRGALVDWLIAHGSDEHKADESRADLEAACVELHAKVVAGEAQRIQPEAVETEETEETEGGEDGEGEETQTEETQPGDEAE